MANRKKTSRAPTDIEPPKGLTLLQPPDTPDQTRDQFMAKAAAGGIVGNARTLVTYGKATFGELSLTECVAVLKQTAQGLNGGDLGAAVAMLSAQAVALDSMFGELARRSALNMGEYTDAMERYMRLALKAQGQCRATLETLAAIKNPPVVFAKQANIANGPQQVNNGLNSETSTRGRARDIESEPTELLEATYAQRMDTGATGSASRTDSDLAPLGKVDRAA